MADFMIARSATETMMQAMESLGEAEDNQVFVIIRNTNGDVITHNNLRFGSERIGLLRTAQLYEEAKIINANRPAQD